MGKSEPIRLSERFWIHISDHGGLCFRESDDVSMCRSGVGREEIKPLSDYLIKHLEEPEPSLDEQVAREVMGWEKDDKCWMGRGGDNRLHATSSVSGYTPSKGLHQAIDALEHVLPEGEEWDSECLKDGGYDITTWSNGVKRMASAEAPTRPEAFCKAALEIVRRGEGEG